MITCLNCASIYCLLLDPPKITDNTARIGGFLVSPINPGGPVSSRPGREVVFTCKAAIGKSTPQVKWYRQGKEVTDSDGVSILSDGSLRLTNVQVDDEDNYTCTATNIVGTDSSVIWLAVNGKTITLSPHSTQSPVLHVEFENQWVVLTGSCSRTCAGGKLGPYILLKTVCSRHMFSCQGRESSAQSVVGNLTTS